MTSTLLFHVGKRFTIDMNHSSPVVTKANHKDTRDSTTTTTVQPRLSSTVSSSSSSSAPDDLDEHTVRMTKNSPIRNRTTAGRNTTTTVISSHLSFTIDMNHSSPVILTDPEEREMHRLQRSGALKDVVGSQSILSQELMEHFSYQVPHDAPGETDIEDHCPEESTVAAPPPVLSCEHDSDVTESPLPSQSQLSFVLSQGSLTLLPADSSESQSSRRLLSLFESQEGSPCYVGSTMNNNNLDSLLDAVERVQSVSSLPPPLVAKKKEDKQEDDIKPSTIGQVKQQWQDSTKAPPPLPMTVKKDEEQEEDTTPSTVGQVQQPWQDSSTVLRGNGATVADGQHGTLDGARSSAATMNKNDFVKQPPSGPVETNTGKPSRKRSSPVPTGSPGRKKHLVSQRVAQEAAALASQVIQDPALAKKLLLSMALQQNVEPAPRQMNKSTTTTTTGVVPKAFFWSSYPPLEDVLKQHMPQYYEMSTQHCQSGSQQAFNNSLVAAVLETARQHNWVFDQVEFDHKRLRDRIRCYYKTHIQNARKRLQTMLKNPTKQSNARHLMQHYHLVHNIASLHESGRSV